MKFPKEYIKHGEFTLHSGGKTNILYDVNGLLTDNFYVDYILREIPQGDRYIGIATGGAIIASLVSRDRLKGKFSMVKDGELKGIRPERHHNWILIDDVVTTGASLEEAVDIIKRIPSEIVIMLDRRKKNENPKVTSIFEI